MEARKPSRSAILVAVARELHRREEQPPVLDDPLAEVLAGEDLEPIAEQLRRELPEQARVSLIRWMCVRSRATEDELDAALADGVGQLVSLGAGLDSFAYRRRELEGRLRVFEVDHPASQAWKRERLAAAGVSAPANLVFAAVDFERESLADGLAAAGFESGRPAFFSWLGVTMYLTTEAIELTLRTIAGGAAGSRLAMTYNVPQDTTSALGRETQLAMRRILGEMGEPVISFFEPAEAEALAERSGFDAIRHFGPEEALAAYYPGRKDVSFGGAQRLLFARVPFPR